MAYKVVLSEKAKEQIVQCVAFVNRVNKKAAIELNNLIIEAVKSLKEMPSRCPVIDFLRFTIFEFRKLSVLDGRYAIIFRITNQTVYIDYFIDNRKENYLDIL